VKYWTNTGDSCPHCGSGIILVQKERRGKGNHPVLAQACSNCTHNYTYASEVAPLGHEERSFLDGLWG
jgi:hypothetical protein